MKRFLVTGGAGFIGFHLCRFLLNQGHEVVAIDNFSRGQRDSEFLELSRHLTFIEADLSKCFPDIHGDFDGVFHLAGVVGVEDVLKEPYEVFQKNVRILFETFNWLRKNKIKSFVYASSSEVYGWGQETFDHPVPTPEDVPLLMPPRKNYRGGYALSKMNGEVLTEMVCSENLIPFSILRLHNVYGPRMGHSHVIPQLWQQMKTHPGKLCLQNSSNTRAFCYVEDAVKQLYESILHPVNDILNVGNDQEEISIAELAAKMSLHMNPNLVIETQVDGRDPFKRRCPDMTKRYSYFGQKSFISLDEGLKRSIDWYNQSIQ